MEHPLTPEERQIPIHGPAEFEGMRKAGQLAARTLDFITPHVQPGDHRRSRQALRRIHRRPWRHFGAEPGLSETSVNHVVCHGIPGPASAQGGDIINIDVTPALDGWHEQQPDVSGR